MSITRICGRRSLSLLARLGPDRPLILTSLRSRSMVPGNSASSRTACFALLAGNHREVGIFQNLLDELEKEPSGLQQEEWFREFRQHLEP